MKRLISIFVPTLTLLLIVGALTSCSSRKAETTATPEVVHGVQLSQATSAEIPDVLEAPGTVHAFETAQLAPQMMGTIVAVKVHEGDRVSRGEVLALIDAAQPAAGVDRAQAAVAAANHEVAAAESQYKLAKSTLARYQSLFDKHSVSPQEFDVVKTRVEAASAQRDMAKSGQAQATAALAQARTMLSYTQIRAPFNGAVTVRSADPGALASPGMPILTIESTGRYRLETSVDESQMQYVHLGEKLQVRFDTMPGKELNGTVSQIIPAADPSSRNFLVKIDLPVDSALRSGIFGRAMFVRGQRNAIILPQTAVVNRGALQVVYVVNPDKLAQLRYVTTGHTTGDSVVILSGISPNETVVTAPGDLELAGKRVEVQ